MADQKAEGRAIWVVRFDLTSPESIKKAVAYAKDNNFNILVVQVRGRGDAYYNSHFEPRAEELADQPLDFDPLAVYIAEGHKAGLKIYAWLNTHLSWSYEQMPKSPEHIVNKHPEWLMHNFKGDMPLAPGDELEGAYTCPSNPEVKEHVANCFLDVVKNYDVDGINFDYVRYPSINYCFCDGCLSRFKAEMDKELSPDRIATLNAMTDRLAYVQSFPQKWDDFRRRQITELVERIYRSAKEIKPNIVVTADVFPGYDDAYNHRFQDWKLWMEKGIMDAAYLMAYTKDTDAFAEQVKFAVDNSKGRHVYGGIGQWQNTLEGNLEKVQKARELGAQGISLFSYGSSTDGGTSDEFLKKVKEDLFQDPAPVPDMDWVP